MWPFGRESRSLSDEKLKELGWRRLDSLDQIPGIIESSGKHPIIIFKHSTSCSISAMAKNRLEKSDLTNADIEFYYLDLLKHRDVSNAIAGELGVRHESPQIIIIKDGIAVDSASHGSVKEEFITSHL